MSRIYQIVKEKGLGQLQIIENVGRNLAELALQFVNKKLNPKIVILTGPNCNGATGICAARHLINHSVNPIICKSRGYHLSEEVQLQANLYKEVGGKEAHVGSLPIEPVDLIIDALIGFGLNGPPKGPITTLIQWANANGAPILALENPTGVDISTGQVLGLCINPTGTLTLGLPKVGQLQERTGQLYLCDIGIPFSFYSQIGIQAISPFREKFIIRLFAFKK